MYSKTAQRIARSAEIPVKILVAKFLTLLLVVDVVSVKITAPCLLIRGQNSHHRRRGKVQNVKYKKMYESWEDSMLHTRKRSFQDVLE